MSALADLLGIDVWVVALGAGVVALMLTLWVAGLVLEFRRALQQRRTDEIAEAARNQGIEMSLADVDGLNMLSEVIRSRRARSETIRFRFQVSRDGRAPAAGTWRRIGQVSNPEYRRALAQYEKDFSRTRLDLEEEERPAAERRLEEALSQWQEEMSKWAETEWQSEESRCTACGGSGMAMSNGDVPEHPCSCGGVPTYLSADEVRRQHEPRKPEYSGFNNISDLMVAQRMAERGLDVARNITRQHFDVFVSVD
jgi:hypothetical protein